MKEIRLDLFRIANGVDDTLGYLDVDGVFECYTLEDEFRDKKVFGETRIPSGKYNIVLREEDSPKVLEYKKKYSYFTGHLMLENVPGFEFVYIHVGNKESDTDGCILVGDGQISNLFTKGSIGPSVPAFERLYKKIHSCIKAGGKVTINIQDKIKIK